jgi:aminoglycoside phosphotransferase family enzyme
LDQTETVAFLSSPDAFRQAGEAVPDGAPVETVETHGAYVFLCGTVALKLKRAVTYDYMDLGTVAKRHAMLARELELNAPAAPMIYRDVLPVTRGPKGLRLGGEGAAVDWVLRMWRFPAEEEFEAIAARGDLDDALAMQTGESIAAYHAAAPVIDRPGAALIGDILDELDRVFAAFPGAAGAARVQDWEHAAREAHAAIAPLLDRRSHAGHVRRCHGDLHLRNLVRIDGRPVPFDALEFDETLGTCDVLYDTAFLVMDLCHRGLDRQACRALDAWLREARGAEDDGLAALPLFVSVRAAIRAMVLLQTNAAREEPGASAEEIGAYLDLACRALRPASPRLIAVGGYSGTGKSVLARAMAPGIGALPGAVILASDLERKAGRAKDRAVGAERYTASARGAVYDALLDRAAEIAASGHSVLLDATFLDPDLRARARAVAERAGIRFDGLWLDAPRPLLEARVANRQGDASDADVEGLLGQFEATLGAMDWARVDAGGLPDETLAAARAVLAQGRV